MGLCHAANWFQDYSNVLDESLQSDDTPAASDFVAPNPPYFPDDPDAQPDISYYPSSPTCEELEHIEVDSGYADTPQTFTEVFPGRSDSYSGGATFMDMFRRDKYAEEWQENLYYPFASEEEWQFSSWCLRSGLSMATIDSLLSLSIVSCQIFYLDWHLITITKDQTDLAFVLDCQGASCAYRDPPTGATMVMQADAT